MLSRRLTDTEALTSIRAERNFRGRHQFGPILRSDRGTSHHDIGL